MNQKIYIPSAKPFFLDEDIPNILDEIKKVLKTGRLILGPYTNKFEELFKEYVGVKHAISVNCCTTALEICMKYFKVKDSEVIIPTNTFVATSNSVIYAGGKPIFADIEKNTLCIDVNEILEIITHRTKAIIIVHIAGMIPPKIKEIQEICEDHNLFLIEDAAHAHGASIDDVKAGSLGDVGCFSFYPTKIMTTCTGRMITTNNDKLAEFAKSLRHHGQGKSLREIENFGNDWVMDEISAILGIYQVEKLDYIIESRNKIADRYTDEIKKLEGITYFPVPKNIRHGYYKYPVLLTENLNKDRLVERLEKEWNIETGTLYYPPCHLQPVYKRNFGYKEGMFPVAEDILKRQITLPMYPQLEEKNVDYVLDGLKKSLKAALKV